MKITKNINIDFTAEEIEAFNNCASFFESMIDGEQDDFVYFLSQNINLMSYNEIEKMVWAVREGLCYISEVLDEQTPTE